MIDRARRDERGEVGAREIYRVEGEGEPRRGGHLGGRLVKRLERPGVADLEQLRAQRARRVLLLRKERHGDDDAIVDRDVRARRAADR